jgi:hypothetical protein
MSDRPPIFDLSSLWEWLARTTLRASNLLTGGLLAVYILVYNRLHDSSHQLALEDYLCLFFLAALIASYNSWNDMRRERDNATAESRGLIDQTTPRIVLTFKRLTIDSIGKEQPEETDTYILAWVEARNDGRASPLKDWHVLLRTDTDPMKIGPIPLKPRDWLQEFTHTEGGAPGSGQMLRWTEKDNIEKKTECTITQSDNPGGFAIGKIPHGTVKDLEELRTRIYVQCQDIKSQTIVTDRIEGFHRRGKLDFYDLRGVRIYP